MSLPVGYQIYSVHVYIINFSLNSITRARKLVEYINDLLLNSSGGTSHRHRSRPRAVDASGQLPDEILPASQQVPQHGSACVLRRHGGIELLGSEHSEYDMRNKILQRRQSVHAAICW